MPELDVPGKVGRGYVPAGKREVGRGMEMQLGEGVRASTLYRGRGGQVGVVPLDRKSLFKMMNHIHLMVVKVVFKVSTLHRVFILQGRSGRELGYET